MRRLIRLGVVGMFVLGTLLFSAVAEGTDIPIFPTGPVYKITPALVWGTSTPPGFNNNYFFAPLNINESVCVFVYNNNTTNPHTFTAAIQVTGDPSSVGPATGTWQSAASSSGLLSATAPGIPAGIGASVTGASQVSVNLSASSTQAGGPDTATVVVVQTSGNCFAGNQFIGSAPQTVAAVKPNQAVSDGLSQSFVSLFSATNPAAGLILTNVNDNSASKSLYFNTLNISCSAACQLQIATSTSLGTGCAGSVVVNQKISSSTTSVATVQNGPCGVAPAGTVFYNGLQIGAGNNIIIDLAGFIGSAGTVTGIQVNVSNFTGTVSGFISWYEK